LSTIRFNQHENLDEAKLHHQDRVDGKAGAVRQRFAHNWLIEEEYELAAKQAQAYVDNGYNGEAPEAVQAWADAAGMTGQGSADNILAMRAAYKAELENIRRIRLTAKQQVAQASTEREAFDAAEHAISQLDAVTPP